MKRMSRSLTYRNARYNLWLVTAITALNVLFVAISDTYLLFSAQIPLFCSVFGWSMYAEEGMGIAWLIGGIAVGLILTLPYLVCAIFSKKHYGFMIAALVLFSMDTLLMFWWFGIALSMVLDYLFHAWVLYYLIVGVKVGKEALSEPDEVTPDETDLSAQDDSSQDDFAQEEPEAEDESKNSDENDRPEDEN